LRTAYVELNWNNNENVLRVGQYHNLLFGMIAASGAHPATMGYMAGQLGWRSPGVTYSHKFNFSKVRLYTAAQVNRNSWNDNAMVCSTTSVPAEAPPTDDCLPYGVSLGEAGWPQFEARVLVSGGMAKSPWPQYYAPNLWQLYIVGHWDQKDLSGVGKEAPKGMRDSMQTIAGQAGGKVTLGPVMIAANGWYGQNAGSIYGNMFQMQTPDKPDVNGFGAWGQIAFSFPKNFSLWVFGGIDQPNRDEAIDAGFYFLRNIKLDAMLAYINGPLAITLEFYHFITTTYRPEIPEYGITALESTDHANQPSISFVYMFDTE
jgi:hypothetical protein